MEKREDELLKFVDLAPWKYEMVENLSGGMKHRVSLACTLIHQPKLLFLDEPTVGVDPELRVSFWDYFHELRENGVTILITTYYMDEARHCDRIGFMKHGRFIAEDGPHELLKKSNIDEARQKVIDGQLSAVIVFPEDFSKNAFMKTQNSSYPDIAETKFILS